MAKQAQQPPTDEFTEIRDIEVARIDAVKGAANGTRFLIAKSGSLFSDDDVREIAKRDISQDERDSLDDSDFAGKDDSYPIAKPEDVAAAAASIGRAGPDNYSPDQLKANIIRIATRKGPAFVAQLPESWRSPVDDETKKAAKPQDDEKPAEQDAADDEPDEDADDSDGAGEQSKAKKAAAESEKPAEAGKPKDPNEKKLRKARQRIKKLAKANGKLRKAAKADKVEKAGARNSAADQGHLDAIHDHVVAAGYDKCMEKAAASDPNGGATSSVSPEVAKSAADELIDNALAPVRKAVPVGADVIEALRAEFKPIRDELRTIGKMAAGGGPRIALERDGSLAIAAGGQPGVSMQYAALQKAQERFQKGSPEYEALGRAAALDWITENRQG